MEKMEMIVGILVLFAGLMIYAYRLEHRHPRKERHTH